MPGQGSFFFWLAENEACDFIEACGTICSNIIELSSKTAKKASEWGLFMVIWLLLYLFLLTLQHIFMWEQEEYKKEGIDWTGVTFADNKPVLVRDWRSLPINLRVYINA